MPKGDNSEVTTEDLLQTHQLDSSNQTLILHFEECIRMCGGF